MPSNRPATLLLLQRIDLTVVAGDVDGFPGNYRRGLHRAAHPRFPHDLSRGIIQRDNAAALDVDDGFADDWRRSNHLPRPYLPSQRTGWNFPSVQVAVLAAYHD